MSKKVPPRMAGQSQSRRRLRADLALVERGLFESRAKARAAIEAGLVDANGAPVRKASDMVDADSEFSATAAHPYVSRGGIKLTAALDHFGFDPRGLVCLDVGASTGGFTQVLLERGARRIYAVDVGRDQLHQALRNNPTVVSLEATDIRALPAERLEAAAELIVVDVSFISLKLVLPAVTKLAAASARLIALIKPQFEAGPALVKKGIVRDPRVHAAVCDEIAASTAALGWLVAGVMPSPIEGGDGNREFLLGATRD